jgi:hypothetical protein
MSRHFWQCPECTCTTNHASCFALEQSYKRTLTSSRVLVGTYIQTHIHVGTLLQERPPPTHTHTHTYINMNTSTCTHKQIHTHTHCPTQGGTPRFCQKCIRPKPPRAHHCRVCKRCVLRMDHHCPWTNNCVGHANHKAFLLCLLCECVFVHMCINGVRV